MNSIICPSCNGGSRTCGECGGRGMVSAASYLDQLASGIVPSYPHTIADTLKKVIEFLKQCYSLDEDI